MKTKLCCLTTLMSFLFLASCTKVQLIDEQKENLNSTSILNTKSSCEVLAFKAQSLTDPEYSYANFAKTVDGSTGRITSIETGIYSGGGINEWIKFNVIYKNKTISLVLAENPSDTAINIKLNNEGFADFTTDGNAPNLNFLPTKLKYKNGKLVRRSISFNSRELVANFSYDQNGNLILMQDVSQFGEVPGRSEFKYDISRTAKNQTYFDEPRGFAENTYMLLQYLNVLPLQPKNIRTGSLVYWEDDYLVADVVLSNHVIDAAGNLISFESVSPESNQAISRYTIDWSCNSSAPAPDVE